MDGNGSRINASFIGQFADNSFGLAMLTGVACIYVVLVLLFKDFVQPSIMLSDLVGFEAYRRGDARTEGWDCVIAP